MAFNSKPLLDRPEAKGLLSQYPIGLVKNAAKHATLELWTECRQRARTDLLYLCRDVLAMPDVDRVVHGPLIDHLQKFDGGKDDIGWIEGVWKGYTPKTPMNQLVGTRRRLVLISRGCLKTSIATTAHSIQWILNYPNVRILLSTGTGEKGRSFLQDIKKEFQHNETLRWLFPELCPRGNVKEWGTQESFTAPGREDYCKRQKLRVTKEPTIMTCSIEKQIATFHFEVIKNDDLIDEMNVRTPEQIASVKKHFGLLRPLLENVDRHWIDLVGTIYHYNDLHYSIVSEQRANHEDEGQCVKSKKCKCVWSVLLQPACEDYPDGKVLWPARLSLQALLDIENDPSAGPSVLYNQYLLNPMPTTASLVESESDIIWVPRNELNGIYPRLSLHMTVDLSGMDTSTNSDNDYTVLNLHGFDHDGRLYVLEVIRSRTMGYEKVIDELFDVCVRHPRLIDIKIQKDNFMRVLQPFLVREQQKRGTWLPIVPVPIPNTRNRKVIDIKRLRPWFMNGTIRLASDLLSRHALKDEIMHFPKGKHDDFLDTLAAAFTNRDGKVVSDVRPHERASATSLVGTWTRHEDGTETYNAPPSDKYNPFTEWNELDASESVDSMTGH